MNSFVEHPSSIVAVDCVEHVTTMTDNSTSGSLNSSGIQCLEQGWLAEALVLFREAIKKMHFEIQGEDDSDPTLDEVNQGTPATEGATLDNPISSVAVCSTVLSQYQDDAWGYFLYHKVFHVNDYTTETELVILLIYNFAFTCHMSGLESGNSVLLRSALKVYQQVLDTMRDVDQVTPGNKISNMTLILTGATCNNMFCIHSYFLETALARGMLGMVRNVYNWMVAYQYDIPTDDATFFATVACLSEAGAKTLFALSPAA